MHYINNIANSFLDQDDEDIAVTKILSKYELNVETNNAYLYRLEDDYNALVDYIEELYIVQDSLPEDIIFQLKNNKNFRNFLLIAIQKKLKNLLYDKKTLVFKGIVSIINLLSFGKDYEIFESYNSYNIDNLSQLFRDYEDSLENSKDDKKEFKLLFEYYIILIETLNELCTINSIDIQRKKSINKIIEALSESINITKFKIPLDEHQINRLNNILGKFIFFFSHIPYVNIEGKKASYLIEEFHFYFEKLTDGYQLSKNTNFGDENNFDKYYKKYLDSVTTLLCTLIYKLEKYYKKEDYKLSMFEDIIEHYEHINKHTKTPKFENIDMLKDHLLYNYLYIHGDELENKPIYIIEQFLNTKQFDFSNMHIIYSIVLFSNDIKEEKLVEILTELLSIEKFTNDYLEFYKLDICDTIINKLIALKSDIIKESLLNLIVNYIEKNKIASHLISIYSKIYLSLSMYFSFYMDTESNILCKKYYFKYKKINGDVRLNNEYSQINQIILQNCGKFLLNDLEIEEDHFPDEHFFRIGTKSMNKFLKVEEINQIYSINQTLSNIVTKIFTTEGLDDDTLNSYIEDFLSKDIFHGLVFTTIEGLCKHKCRLIDIGYEKLEIPLLKGYKLRIAYSTVYKHIFEHIYQENKDYIQQNIINLLISYIKSIPIYKDKITLLFNVDKLQKDLKNINDDEFIFIEFYLNSLEKINLKYGYAKANTMFQEFAQTVNKLTPTYRLSGPKLGIMLPIDSDYQKLIEKIKAIDTRIDNKRIKMNFTFSVSWGNRDNILLKSAYSTILALKSEKRYNEFK